MGKGREICDVLKAIRKKIADTNGISYEPSECHFTGDCQGTCPKCESQLAMLDSAIEEKRQNGECQAPAHQRRQPFEQGAFCCGFADRRRQEYPAKDQRKRKNIGGYSGGFS